MRASRVRFPVEVVSTDLPISSCCSVNSSFHPFEVGKWVLDNTGTLTPGHRQWPTAMYLQSRVDRSHLGSGSVSKSYFLKISQLHVNKDVFYVTSLRHPKHISKKIPILWRLRDVSKINLASICDFSKIPRKNVFMRFPLNFWKVW